MEAKYVIQTLKSSSYKFTKAQQLRDRLKKLPEDLRLKVILELKQMLHQHSEISKPISEMLDGLDKSIDFNIRYK